MYSEHDYLRHIQDEINFILKETQGLEEEAFYENEVLKRAVVRSLEVIGEATSKISDEFKNEYPEISWREMKGTRNKLIHEYFGVDYEIVWDIIKNELPVLRDQIDGILS